MIHGANPSDHAVPFQAVFYRDPEFFTRFPARPFCEAAGTKYGWVPGLTLVTTADGASSVRAFVSEVRLGTPEHGATFIIAGKIAGKHRYHVFCEIYSIYL